LLHLTRGGLCNNSVSRSQASALSALTHQEVNDEAHPVFHCDRRGGCGLQAIT
jgi:hypothetical protein